MSEQWLGKNDRDVIIPTVRKTREWQCAECGHVIEASERPVKCPDCNCVNGDLPIGQRLFIPRSACGWFE